MTVKDIMQSQVLTVSPDSQVSEVARLIFSIGVGGVPVVKGKKVVGIVTEEDLLRKMYPSMKEMMEDWVVSKRFKAVEDKLTDLVHKPVSEVMSNDVVSISPDTEIMKAQSMMLLNNFSRLPVVDDKENLQGIISQGDIFKYLVRREMPKIEQAKYASFIGENYSGMVNWEKRFAYEFPALFYLFKTHHVNELIDLGSWTGDYAIELARRGMHVTGVDKSDLMIKLCKEKRKGLDDRTKRKIKFVRTDYVDLSKNIDGQKDAIICMGNSFPYIYIPRDELVKELYKSTKKNGILVLQILNFNKILKKKRAFLSFNVQAHAADSDREKVYFEFIQERHDKEDKRVNHFVTAFDCQGDEWTFAGMTRVVAKLLTQERVERMLKQAGYREVLISGNMGEYQGEYGHLSLTEPYDEETSDWMNVVAVK